MKRFGFIRGVSVWSFGGARLTFQPPFGSAGGGEVLNGLILSPLIRRNFGGWADEIFLLRKFVCN